MRPIRFYASREVFSYRSRREALEHGAGSSSVLDSSSRGIHSTFGVACHDEENVREAVDGFKGVEVTSMFGCPGVRTIPQTHHSHAGAGAPFRGATLPAPGPRLW